MLPPEQHQIDAGRIPLEHVRGNSDITSVSVVALVMYLADHRIPMDARITAGTFHDQPFLEITW